MGISPNQPYLIAKIGGLYGAYVKNGYSYELKIPFQYVNIAYDSYEDANLFCSRQDGQIEIYGKNGEKLTLRWLTYPSRQELPLLAENVQASLKQIGIEVKINCTANHLDYVKKGEWDIYASAFVCAPTGDPEYFFTTHCLKNSSKNRGGYYNEQLEQLEEQLSTTFDTEGREQLGIKMTQTILDDNAFIFASHLKMSIVSGKGVSGLTAHPSDYYEITAELDMQ